MANWSNPLLTSTYTNFLTEVKDRDTDLALQFDGTTSTNIPTNAIRWNSSVNRWQKWNGSTWGELTSTYALTGLTTTGNATIVGTLGSGTFTSTGSVSGTALLPTGNTVPTNGIYLPSANVLGIATSSTARLIIDASGNVGIGTLSAATGLHVGNAAASATSGNLFISPTAAAGQARLRLYNGGAQAEWLLGQKTSSDHAFKLSKLVSGSESDFFTVDTVGNLSLPATGMRLRLGRILDADVNDAALTLYGGSNDGANIELFGGAHAALANLIVMDASEHRFRSANGATERMRIDSSGRVGIGTSSPGSLLDVRFGTNPITDNGGGVNALRVWTNSALAADSGGAISLGGTSTSAPSQTAFGQIAGRKENATSANYAGYLQFATNNSLGTMSEWMRIDSTGRVGIGTSSPTSELEVGNGSVTAGKTGTVLIGRFSTSFPATGAGYFQLSTNNTDGSNGGLSILTLAGGVLGERLRIDSTGRVGIGTSSPQTSLDIGTGGMARVASASGNNLIQVSTGSTGLGMWAEGATRFYTTGGMTFSVNSTIGTGIPTGYTDAVAIDSTGVLKFNSGFGSVGNAYGCRAWANINAGTTPVIRASGNVSSVTDFGAGVGAFTVSFTAAMPDANFAAVVSAGGGNVEGGDAVVGWAGEFATGYVRIGIKDSTSNANVDTDHCMVAIFR